LTLYDKRETQHRKVVNLYNDFRSRKSHIYTTDYVLDETFTLLFKRLPFAHAQKSLNILEDAALKGYLDLQWITPERFARTKGLRLKFQDKAQISFTDLSSMVVMDELGISTILTGDAHFIHVGMDLQTVP